MANVIAILIIAALLGGAITYIVKAKKKGVKCIGCPDAGTCSHSHNAADQKGCGCGCSSCGGSCH